jgi:hypothetical protein
MSRQQLNNALTFWPTKDRRSNGLLSVRSLRRSIET